VGKTAVLCGKKNANVEPVFNRGMQRFLVSIELKNTGGLSHGQPRQHVEPQTNAASEAPITMKMCPVLMRSG